MFFPVISVLFKCRHTVGLKRKKRKQSFIAHSLLAVFHRSTTSPKMLVTPLRAWQKFTDSDISEKQFNILVQTHFIWHFCLRLSQYCIYMLWINSILGLNFKFLCFKLIIIHKHIRNQTKIHVTIKPGMKWSITCKQLAIGIN